LQDNLARVEQRQPAESLVKSMLFWNHNQPEQAERSFSNKEEAQRAAYLAEFLLHSGVAASQITILAAYQALCVARIRIDLHYGGDLDPDA